MEKSDTNTTTVFLHCWSLIVNSSIFHLFPAPLFCWFYVIEKQVHKKALEANPIGKDMALSFKVSLWIQLTVFFFFIARYTV